MKNVCREEMIQIIIATSQAVASGYRKTGDPEAAIAASNTGYYILLGLGYTHAEIKALFNSYDES